MPKSKFICFFVTEIAGLINKHSYQNQDEQMHHFMNRIIDNKRKQNVEIPKRYHKMIEKNVNESEIKNVQKRIKDIQNYKCSDEIKEEIKRKIYTQRGIKYEDTAVDDYRKESEYEIQTPKEFINRFYIKNDVAFNIGGRIDGFMLDKDKEIIIIEVKNRQNKVFDNIPVYEQVQLECYSRMLKAKKCVFIQRYDHKNHISEYVPNDNLWNEILLGLSVITRNVSLLKESEKTTDKKQTE